MMICNNDMGLAWRMNRSRNVEQEAVISNLYTPPKGKVDQRHLRPLIIHQKRKEATTLKRAKCLKRWRWWRVSSTATCLEKVRKTSLHNLEESIQFNKDEISNLRN